MRYFIGIVPPDDFKQRVINFQEQWNKDRPFEVTEPHITIKAQGGLTPDEQWISKIKTVCEKTEPFKMKITSPAFFGEHLLYLSILSKRLFEFHFDLVEAVNPDSDLIKAYMEKENYIPHLTIGQTSWGQSKQELKAMAKLSETELYPYPEMEVNFLRIYCETSPDQYKPYLDIVLNLNKGG